MWLNLSSGIVTMWPSKPRTPPTLTAMVILPPGPVSTLWTVPRLLPSEDLALSPTKSVAVVTADFFSLDFFSFGTGIVVGPGTTAGRLVWGTGFVAAGGLCGEGGGDCAWAKAVRSGIATSTPALPVMRAS